MKNGSGTLCPRQRQLDHSLSCNRSEQHGAVRLERPIVILGPTTVGKTEVAYGLAQRLRGEVCNADKFYLFDGLAEVTGQSDSNQYPDVPQHLYGAVRPDQALWSVARYSAELKAKAGEILERGCIPIVEGCSHGYARAAVDILRTFPVPPLVIGLRWKTPSKLSSDCERRAASMYACGMARSFDRAYAEGLEESYLLRRCFARDALQALRRREISGLTCQARIAEQLEQHARRHERMLSRIPNVVWIEHDRLTPEATISRILSLVRPVSAASVKAAGK